MSRGSLSYLTKEGFRNVWVNRLMSVASTCVLMSCLVMIGIASMLLINIQSIIDKIENENVIVVFVTDEASKVQTEKLGIELKNLDNVATCTFVSKEEAFEKQLEELGSAAELFKGIDKNPLPDSFKVTVENLSLFEQTVLKIENLDNVLNVRENRQFAAQLASVKTTTTYISLSVIGLLLIVSLFIVSNTVRVTMFNRRLEISIMKSVGATNWFIRWPFMIEGIILGAIAGILSLFLVWGVYGAAMSSLSSVISDVGNYNAVAFKSVAPVMLGAFVAGGIVAGSLGSAISIKKYLKEKELECVYENEV
ncbi:MAG TPA: permease-like cell division protein FtsX [Clostridia bacterium]|nr:permease-like cell division protein FtsX [Clostridia bacterium]